MDNQQQTSPLETRRRKLDDLFDDEPYLSTTMKARQLHEKIAAAQRVPLAEPAEDRPERAPDSADAPLPAADTEPAWTEASEGPHRLKLVCFAPEGSGAPPQSGHISLTEAAEFLRNGVPPSNEESPDAERLRRFRNQVLALWQDGAPAREIDPNRRSRIVGKLR